MEKYARKELVSLDTLKLLREKLGPYSQRMKKN